MTPDGLEKLKNGVFPELQEMTFGDLFLILSCEEQSPIAMEFLELCYKQAQIRMEEDPDFRKRVSERTLELQRAITEYYKGEKTLDEIGDLQNKIRET